MTNANPILDAALRLQAAGLALLPLRGKAPETKLLPSGPDGKPSTTALAAEPATERDIRAWFTARTALNIGVLSGAGERPLLGVDLDPAKCHDPIRAALLRERGGASGELMPGIVLPPSPLAVRTGSDGRHVYFAHPPQQIRCVTRVGHPAGECVDVQAEHRYLVLPPSIHPETKQPYLWVDAEDRVLDLDRVIEILTGDLPPAPWWTIRREADDRQPPESPRIQSGDWISAAFTLPCPEGGAGAHGTGGRKQTLRSLVQYYAQRDQPIDITLAQLLLWNKSLCQPPLADQEVISLTHFIYDKVCEERAIEVAERVNLRVRGPEWPHELFLGTRFGRWVDAVSRSRGAVHPDLVAICGLGALGCASTGGYQLHYLEPGIELEDRHWIAPTALWIMPVAESGQGKSIAFREILPTLEEMNSTLSIVARRYNAELEALTEELQAAKKAAIAQARGEGRAAAVEARREITQRIADLPPPLGERWILSEGTPEAFLRTLSEVDHVALVSEEGDETIGKFFGHYSGAADMNGVLKAWDGGRTVQVRIGRGTTETQGLASILCMVQQGVLRKLQGADAEDRGLMARFLFSVPPPRKTAESEEIPKAKVAAACADFDRVIAAIYYGGVHAAEVAEDRARQYRPEYETDPGMLAVSLPPEDRPKPGRPIAEAHIPPPEKLLRPALRTPVDILFRGECIDALKELESELKASAAEGGEHYTARGWVRKAHEHAMRIAAVLQLCESPPHDHETVIMELAWVKRAISLVRHYFIPHYYVAKDLIDSPPLADLGLHILTHFSDRDSFTLGEAAKLVNKRTPDIRPVIQWLDQVGAIRAVPCGKSVIAYPLPNVVY